MDYQHTLDYQRARINMVDSQIRPNKVKDARLLERFRIVPRERFVDNSYQGLAYSDSLVPMPGGRSLLLPSACAYMMESLHLQSEESLLIIAAGSGYSAVLASGMVANVTAVEDDPNLTAMCKKLLAEMGIRNVRAFTGDVTAGKPAHGPYDKIFIDGPIGFLPENLSAQLKEGGLLVCAMAHETGILQIRLYSKGRKTLIEHILSETHGDVLPAFQQEETFVF